MSDAVGRHDADQQRYELVLDGEVIALVDYAVRADGVVVLAHVETDPAHRRQGRAAEVMRYAMDDLRAHDRRARPHCPYAVYYLRRHHEYDDLIAA
jgi:uncharacterized protein